LIALLKAKLIAILKFNQQDDGDHPWIKRDRTFINPSYICLIALSKVKMLAFLKFNQQEDGDRAFSKIR
jgi:hypothetical protein